MPVAPAWLDDLAFMGAAGRAPDGRWTGPSRWLHVGLSRTAGTGLIADGDRGDELAERKHLLDARRAEVFAARPGSADANREVLAIVEDWWRSTFAAEPPTRAADDPLEAAGRLVQEDLCVLLPSGTGDFQLEAACVCFPSHWLLADKLGQPVTAIHETVPRYALEVADRVDRFLERLRPGVVAQRRNWTVHDRPDRFAPRRPGPDQRVPLTGTDDVGSRRWLRSELQTFRRLPDSGGVLFTIKTQRVPFAVLSQRPDAAAALATRLRSQPAALTATNGIGPELPIVLAWLDRVAGA